LKFTKNRLFSICLSATLTLCGCSTMTESLLLGLGTGAVSGAVVSNQSGGANSEKVGTGAAIGAAVGGLSAYLIHKSIEKRDERLRRETLLNLEKYDVSAPQRLSPVATGRGGGHGLTKPVVDMEWIETKVEGDRLVEGHKVWRIIEKPKWIPSEDMKATEKKEK
jgi:hypothetical protein